MVTTAGFEDVIHIGRQNRAELYNLTPQLRSPLIPRAMCFGVRERAYFDGTIAQSPSSAEIARLKTRLRRARVESVAICFLHAYRNPKNEKQVAAALEGLGYLCSSHDVCPEFREYERSSTTLINAYVGPLMDKYLGELERAGAKRHPIAIMQSNGGFMPTKEARKHAVRTVLSGPAGGVVGALEVARLSGFSRILGFDMGGTSTDVSLCDGHRAKLWKPTSAGFRCAFRCSIFTRWARAAAPSRASMRAGCCAWVRKARAPILDRPATARARGPRLPMRTWCWAASPRDQLIGGGMQLEPGRAAIAVDSVARALKIGRIAAAQGILRVANANMERAIRLVSVERGHDPRDFALVAFGGCGGLHACEIAQELGIQTVLVPEYAGALSALGMLLADRVRDHAAGVLNRSDLEREFVRLERIARKDLRGAELIRSADIRYAGQSYELMVPWRPDNPAAPFHQEHQRVYGYSNPERAIEIVTIRVRARLTVKKPSLVAKPNPSRGPKPALRRIHSAGVWRDTPVYPRSSLTAATVRGPALVADYGSTTLVPPGWRFSLDKFGSLALTWRTSKSRAAASDE